MEILQIIFGVLILTYVGITVGITLYWLFGEWYDLGGQAYQSSGVPGFIICAGFTFLFVAILVAPVEIIAHIWKGLLKCKNILKSIFSQFRYRLAHLKSEIKNTSEEK